MQATLKKPASPVMEPMPALARKPGYPPATKPTPAPDLELPRTIHRTIRDDGICVLTFDRPDSAANVFDLATLEELRDELDFVEQADGLTGLIVTSAKKSIFIAGLDLHSIGDSAPLEEIRELVELGQTQIDRVARLNIPTAAAIHGAAMGGGCEIALACDHRIASTDRKTKIGLPETLLGLIPAWGGATRLPRLIGLPKALAIILAGKSLAPKPALKCGLVDELAPAEYLLEVAARRIGRGKPRRSRRFLTNNRASAAIIAARVRPDLEKRTRGKYPAIFKALEVMTRGLSRSVPESLALERRAILELAETDASRSLLRLFLLQDRAKKLSMGERTTAGAAKIRRTAVIGAGVMGAGVAQWLSAKGLPVVLRDINATQVGKGMATINTLFQEGRKRHVFTPTEARAGMDRIQPAPQSVPLQRVDLVIEAAVEKMELKKEIFGRLEALTREDTILATNTSALSVSELAASTRHPERVIGLHFFNPVHRMQLVEIIRAEQTSPEVLERTLKFTQKIGKLPVVVKDSPGFLVNRILMPYLVEAGTLFELGASTSDLDEAMLEFGMPMGPMRLLDEVGIDVARHVAATLAVDFSERMKVPELLDRMIASKRIGRKSGKGFYSYANARKPKPDPTTSRFVNPTAARLLSQEHLQERMVLLMINEAARCLEEEIVTDPADVDFAMVMGTGFAPFRGGPLRHADQVGLPTLVDAMNRWVDRGETHFQPCDLLKERADDGGTFYRK